MREDKDLRAQTMYHIDLTLNLLSARYSYVTLGNLLNPSKPQLP